jgi:hypothetical protein
VLALTTTRTIPEPLLVPAAILAFAIVGLLVADVYGNELVDWLVAWRDRHKKNGPDL